MNETLTYKDIDLIKEWQRALSENDCRTWRYVALLIDRLERDCWRTQDDLELVTNLRVLRLMANYNANIQPCS